MRWDTDVDLGDEDVFNEYFKRAIRERWGARTERAKVIPVPLDAYQLKVVMLADDMPLMPVQPEWVDCPGIKGRVARWLGNLLKKPFWGLRAKYSPVDAEKEVIELEVCQIGMWKIHVGYGPKSNVLAVSERRLIDRFALSEPLNIKDVEKMFDELVAALEKEESPDGDGE